jgi:predicted TIM-barrel fold metal-dependent hydrolase
VAVDLVIDADGHCSEPTDELTKWLPQEWVARAPVSVKDGLGRTKTLIEGRTTSKSAEALGPGVSAPFGLKARTASRPGMKDPIARLADMDAEGIDVAVIFGTPIALSVNGLRDVKLAAALAHGVNRWLVEEYLVPDPKRLKGVGLIPCQDPPAAVQELEFLAQQPGIVSAMLPTNVYGINMGDRRFDPIYAAAQELNMPLAVHPQTGHDGQYGVWGVMGAGSERMEKYAYVHMTAFAFEPMIALMHMIGEGVFDRYPRLKVAYVEGACGWVPFWAERMDEHFEKLGPQWPLLQRKPSEIIASGQVSFTCEPEETILPYVLDTIGESQVMYASDYHHWDCEFPESVHNLVSIPGLTEERQRIVLGRNALTWFNLKPETLPARSVYLDREVASAAAGGS